MKEIVAIKVGSIITNIPEKIIEYLQSNQEIEFLARERMQFMAMCDLGQKWDSLANGRTLFLIDDSDEDNPVIYSVKGEKLQ